MCSFWQRQRNPQDRRPLRTGRHEGDWEFAQIGLGGLVAGLRAGLVYNTWPWMDGRFIPPADHLFSLSPWVSNLVDNVTTTQFEHRMTAYLLLALALFHALHISREHLARRAVRRASALAALILVQAGLGVTTLLLVVPLWAGLLHQAFAMIVLAMATIHRRKLGWNCGFSGVTQAAQPQMMT